MTHGAPTISPLPLIAARAVRNAARAARRGDLVNVIHGVYADPTEWRELPPWERYLARVHAVTLRYPEATLCLESAAAIRGLPVFGDPGTVHLLADDDARSRVSSDIRLHTSADARELEVMHGVLVTSLADTVVDVARSRHHAVGLAVADAALRESPELTTESLAAINIARTSSRGRRHARWVLDRASSLPETPLESVDRAVIEWLGFPEPTLQAALGEDRVDKWWPAFGIAGEGDGDLKYDGRFGDGNEAMRRRHERDARLFRHGARSVPHWGWAEAIAAEPLEAILRSAGLPLTGTRDSVELHSLRRAVRSR